MWTAASVLVCVLDVLGRNANTLPPIVMLEVRPPDVSLHADAFVRQGDDTIYLITSNPTFQRVQRSKDMCAHRDALRKLASILIHEEWHVRNGNDERGAYIAQLTALIRLNAGTEHPLYGEVMHSMQVALAAPTRASSSRVREQGTSNRPLPVASDERDSRSSIQNARE
jgi:hypothetical protein